MPTAYAVRFCLLCLALPLLVYGQISTATLTGIITDPTQAKVPAVHITLVNTATGVTNETSSNTQGEFTFTLMPPGDYRLSAEAAGFRRYNRTGLVMESGRTFRVDIAMELGQISEAIDVTGTAPLLESESATVG